MEATALSHLYSVLNAASDRAADVAVTALWQGALVAGALALCLSLAPRLSAAYRFATWATGFIALVFLSAFALIPQFSAGATNGLAARAAENAARPWFSVDARWSVAIAALWLAASLYRGVDLAIHSLRLRRLWKDAQPVQLEERVAILLATNLADCGRDAVEVCTTTTLQRPSVIGFLKPRILVPDWLFGRMTRGELEQIVLHESEHLRRRDDWTNLVQKFCLVLFPLNPALVWIERRLCREREMACDDAVIGVTRAPRAYAACLASLAERGLERRVEALSLGAWQRRPELVHRVHSILQSKGGLSPVSARVLLGTVGCGLLAGSLELAQSPQLVVFVPEHSAIAGNEIENLNLAKTGIERTVQIASFENGKTGPRTVHAVPLMASAKTESPGARGVLVRESSQSAAVPATAKAEERRAKVANEQNQQWIVLTEWQQVETTGKNAGLRPDYDRDGSAGQNADLPANALPQQDSRITVTQLIFRISPAGLPADSGLPARPGVPANAKSKSLSKPTASSPTNQPDVATFRDGWLVLQL